MEIKRIDCRPGTARVVIHNNVAYFTGHVAAGKQATLKEQVAAVFARYDELFAKFGMKKENILFANAYLKDISTFREEYEALLMEWVGTEHAPAGVAVQAQCADPDYLIELALIVAVD